MKVKCNFIEINVTLVLSCLKILQHGILVKKGNSLCESEGLFSFIGKHTVAWNYC